MSDVALRPIIRAIVDRPFLIGITVFVGLFTLAYTGAPTGSETEIYSGSLIPYFAWVLSFAVGVQIFLFAPAFRRVLICGLWLVASGLLFAPALENGTHILFLFTAMSLGLLVTMLGAVLSRRISIAIFSMLIVGALAIAAGQSIAPGANALLAMASVYLVQTSLFVAVKFDQARLQVSTTRIAAGISMGAVLPFVFFALLIGVVLTASASMVDLIVPLPSGTMIEQTLYPVAGWADGFKPFSSLSIFAAIGFFVLPLCLILPGFLWLSTPLDNGFRDPREGRLDALVPTFWAKVRFFYSLPMSYATVLIAAIVTVVLMLAATPIELASISAIIAAIALCAGLSFFSLRVFIFLIALMPLTVWPAFTITALLAKGLHFTQLQTVDSALGIFILAASLGVVAREFAQTSLNVKFSGTFMVTLLSRSLGAYLLTAGAGMLMTLGIGLSGLWPAAMGLVIFQIFGLIATVIIAPALLRILSSRYGKF